MVNVQSWNQRFALIDRFQPNDTQIMSVFAVTEAELKTARAMRVLGTFAADNQYNVEQHGNIFTSSKVKTAGKTIIAPRETSTKPIKTVTKGKRGYNGTKIITAFRHVTEEPQILEEFAKKHNVSPHNFVQAKRFTPAALVPEIGVILVRKDKATQQRVVFRVKPKV